MKYVIQLSIVSMSIAFCSCNHLDAKEKAVVDQHKEILQFITLSPKRISSTVQLPGVIQPFEFVQVYPKVNGFIKDMYVDRGSIVRKGQVLLTLEAPEIEEHVSEAKLKYQDAYANYLMKKDRYERLLEASGTPGTVSTFDLEASKSSMQADSATAQGEWSAYKAQQDMYSYLTITAPFDGVITERNVHPGALVSAQDGKPMLVLQQQSKLRLIVDIPEQYTSRINNSDVVNYTINALPGQYFTGKIARSSGSLNDSYRSETIELDVTNPDHLFKAGMYAEVVLNVDDDANAFIVPKSTVITTTEHKYVIADENGQAKWIDVSEGDQLGDSTEIFGQLHNGYRLIANANYQIKDGQQLM
jgi:RND family efflux transporter MFP subunit